MTGRNLAQGRRFLAAALLYVAATRVKVAACRRVGRVGHITCEDDTGLLPPHAGVRVGHCRQQGLRVGV